MNIAVILPKGKSDYLGYTILDGLMDLQKIGMDIQFHTTSNFPGPFDLNKYEKIDNDFIEYAKTAEMIILVWGKNSTNIELAEKINRWDKVVFIDGSELGKNNRFDKQIQKSVIDGTYEGIGSINSYILSKCKLYFRREKPYINGIIPFPFGIETRYRKFYNQNKVRDIDFTCIFGQDEYPILRRQAREYLEKFCKKNGFTFHTKKTEGFNFDDNSKKAGREEFYEILSRTKVGISIGGGGFDTARFWEILGSGAVLLTEKIDIYNDGGEYSVGNRLSYNRIHEFNNLEEFKIKLDELSMYLRSDKYNQDISALNNEYSKVIEEHSTASRVKQIIDLFNK